MPFTTPPVLIVISPPAETIVPLAVTSTERVAVLKDVPTFEEIGYPEMNGAIWFWLAGPKGMPAPVVQRLTEAFNKVSAMPEVDQQMREVMFLRPKTVSPDDYRQYLERELAKWRELSKTVKIGTT